MGVVRTVNTRLYRRQANLRVYGTNQVKARLRSLRGIISCDIDGCHMASSCCVKDCFDDTLRKLVVCVSVTKSLISSFRSNRVIKTYNNTPK